MKFNYLFLLCLVLPHTTQPMLSTVSRALKPNLLVRTFLTNPQRDIYRTRLGKLNDKKKDEEANINRLNESLPKAFGARLTDGIYIGTSLQLNQSKQNLLTIEREIFQVETKLAE